MVLRSTRQRLGRVRAEFALPARARRERQRDHAQPPGTDPGIDAVIDSALRWLCRAQDRSRSADGGVARDFSLVNGWASSYPETTGYIVPTFLELGAARRDADLVGRARRMLDWLVAIQYPDGPFQGGKIDASVKVPVTFNTGQILLGLAAGSKHLDAFAAETAKCADWLVRTQDADGCWRAYATPFAKPGEKAYETHVAWGLFEAFTVTGDTRHRDAAVANVRWAIGQQENNGWIRNCCLSDPAHPLTHTLGYALRGIVEAYLATGESEFLRAARRTADGFVAACQPDGFLPGRWSSDWRPAVDWVCLTGSVQIAHSLLLLHRVEANDAYLGTGRALNAFVRRTVRTDGDPDVLGGVKGAFPVDGEYGSYEYLNWAAKFCIDANVIEQQLVHE